VRIPCIAHSVVGSSAGTVTITCPLSRTLKGHPWFPRKYASAVRPRSIHEGGFKTFHRTGLFCLHLAPQKPNRQRRSCPCGPVSLLPGTRRLLQRIGGEPPGIRDGRQSPTQGGPDPARFLLPFVQGDP
jgi:hypothetical protein